MIKLAGITIFLIVFMSLLAGLDPAKVMVTLIEMPTFQGFVLLSFSAVFAYSILKRISKNEDREKKS